MTLRRSGQTEHYRFPTGKEAGPAPPLRPPHFPLFGSPPAPPRGDRHGKRRYTRETHPLLAQGPPRHHRLAAEIVETLTRIGLEVEGVEDPGAKFAGLRHRPRHRGQAASERRPAARLHRRRRGRAGAGGVRRAERAHRHEERVLAGRDLHSRQEDHLAEGRHPRRRVRTACCARRRNWSFPRITTASSNLPEDAPVGVAYAAYAGLDDPVIDINLTPNRPDATGHFRHRPRPRGGGARRAEDAAGRRRSPARFDCPVKVKLDLAPATKPLPRLRAAAGARRPQRPVAGLDAAAAARHRAEADQRAGRHHQLSDLRPRPAAACVRRAQGRGRPRGAAGAAGRERGRRSTAAPMRSTEANVVIADDKGVESIAGVMGGEHSGCDEATTDVLIESALWDPVEYRAHRARSRHRHRRALSLRARRRSRFLRARRGAGDPAGARALRRRAVAADRRRRSDDAAEARRLSPIPRSSGSPASTCRRPRARRSCAGSASGWRTAKRSCRTGGPISTARPTSSSRSSASPGSTGWRRRRCRAPPGVPAPVLTLLQKRTRARQARARGARPRRSRHLVVHSQNPRGAVRRRRAGAGARQPDRRRHVGHAAEPRSPASRRRPSATRGAGSATSALFEVGQIFLGDGDRDQRMAAAALRRGLAKRHGEGRHWSGGGGVDVFDAKGDALALLAALGRPGGRGADRPRRPGLPASRPRGDAAIRAEERRRLVRRIAPERLRGARRRGAAGRRSRSCSTRSRRRRRGRPRPSRSWSARSSCRSRATSLS